MRTILVFLVHFQAVLWIQILYIEFGSVSDPGFWPNLDPDPDPGLNYQFEENNFVDKHNFI